MQSVNHSIYYQLRRQVGFGRYLSVLSESLADYCYGRGNYATSYATGLTSGGVSFTNDTWAVLYRAIRFSNEILSQIGDAKLSQLEYDHLSGEARFLRAFSYSYLARYYGAVPFFDEHNMHDFNKPRTPERDIWEFVAREAADAAALLPESVAQAGRPARYAALMLETEALLYLERWSEAAAAVGKVIDSDRYGLVEVSEGRRLRKNLRHDGQRHARGDLLFQIQPGRRQQLHVDVSLPPESGARRAETSASTPTTRKPPSSKDGTRPTCVTSTTSGYRPATARSIR